MRAAVLHGRAGSGDLRTQEVAEPELGPGDVMIQVGMAGICGSDVHFVFDGKARPAYTPIILGHETMGRVADVGAGVQADLQVGQRVAIVPLVTCATCDRCRAGRTVICEDRGCLGADLEGSFADLLAVPERNVLPVPDTLSDELAAVATDSVATAYHAVALRGGVGPASRVVVWGTGGLGLSAVGIARTLGAETVIAVDPREEARTWALATGADEAWEPDGVVERLQGLGGADVSLEFVGTAATAELAVRSTASGGRAVIVGVGDGHVSAGRLMTFVLREREVVGSYGAEPGEVAEVIDLMARGDLVLPHVVGDVVPFDDLLASVARVRDGRTVGSRIVVDVAGS